MCAKACHRSGVCKCVCQKREAGAPVESRPSKSRRYESNPEGSAPAPASLPPLSVRSSKPAGSGKDRGVSTSSLHLATIANHKVRCSPPGRTVGAAPTPALSRRSPRSAGHPARAAAGAAARRGRAAAGAPPPSAAAGAPRRRRGRVPAGGPLARRQAACRAAGPPAGGVRSHCRFVRLRIHVIRVIPDSLINSVPLFLKRQCDQTLPADRRAGPCTRARCRWPH